MPHPLRMRDLAVKAARAKATELMPRQPQMADCDFVISGITTADVARLSGRSPSCRRRRPEAMVATLDGHSPEARRPALGIAAPDRLAVAGFGDFEASRCLARARHGRHRCRRDRPPRRRAGGRPRSAHRQEHRAGPHPRARPRRAARQHGAQGEVKIKVFRTARGPEERVQSLTALNSAPMRRAIISGNYSSSLR